MFNVILLGIVCFFCAFGVVEFFKLIFYCDGKCKENVLTVVPLKNSECNVESIIRCCIYGGGCDNIIVVDYNSCDNTENIAKTLQQQYTGITTYSKDEFIEFMKDYYND